MRSPLLIVLVFCGCNLFAPTEFSDPDLALVAEFGVEMPVMDASIPDAQLPDLSVQLGEPVQTGGVRLGDEVEVEITMKDPVDLERSALFFTATTLGKTPLKAHVFGRLSDAQTLRFSRSAGGDRTEIQWAVVQFPDAVVVRGEQCFGGDGVTCAGGNPPLDPMILALPADDFSEAFPLATHEIRGAGFDHDDWLELRLGSALSAYFASAGQGGRLAHQVVAIPGAVVQSGSNVLDTFEPGASVALASFDASRTFPLVTWRSHESIGLVGAHSVRARLENQQLQIERDLTGAVVDFTWFVVQLPQGYNVQIRDVSFDETTLELDTLIDAVAVDRSFVFLSGNQRSGTTTYRGWSSDADGQAVGAAWFTAELVKTGDATADTVRLRRALSAGAAANATFSVITLP